MTSRYRHLGQVDNATTRQQLERKTHSVEVYQIFCTDTNELHDFHIEHPLAPESLTSNNVDKLVPSLNDKTKHELCCSNLKLYEILGLRITKINKGFS